jgi:hypothetical protein
MSEITTQTEKRQCRANRTLKEKLGIALEKWLYALLRVLFPVSLGFRITHPDWSNYNNHHGVDFRVFERNKEILAIECKNWRDIGKKYGTDVAQTEIIDRFRHIGTGLKVCIISFLDVLSKPAIQLVKSYNIRLIQIGKLVGHRDFKASLFHRVKSTINKLVKSQKSSSSNSIPLLASNPITNYTSTDNNVDTKTTIPTYNYNPVTALIVEAIRVSTWERSLREHGYDPDLIH